MAEYRETWTHWNHAVRALADAIRANPPKPPRMTEPGWGERVWAKTNPAGKARQQFLHTIGAYPWQTRDGTGWRWDQLIDPEPVDDAR